MLKLNYLCIFIGALFISETNQQNVHDCKLFCDAVSVIDSETCACVKTAVSEIERKKRSSDGDSTSDVIRGDEFTTHRCSNDEKWNGSACISTISLLCPGGYQWNGRTCIIQTRVETAALVPSPPDTKCKYAKEREKEAERLQMPLMVMPTFSTSPMCPFGFIWLSNSGCVRNPNPVCPSGYSYYNNICHFNQQPLKDTIVETTTQESSTGDIFKQNSITGNKWLKKPIVRYENVELPHKVETENGHSPTDEEAEISYNKNGQRCCNMMTPKICRQVSNELGVKWQCYHQKYRRCGDFCTKPSIYLRPKQISFNEPILIMPPPPPRLMKLMQNHVFRETNIDCSGCLNGTYGCSSECFSYDCKPSTCDFVNDDIFCEESNDDDGSVEIGDYDDICSYLSLS
ncbi:uncharacterized protein LOC116350925 [Contarinia nasturtii]|uniref:uncharacterized protein LOC116350925 n=1 Tax=Contarinia nasturtii TaxID=265458 RepID=UPI0012D41CB6|nr:uncharacterized protein LOC116350925 [Contarinia nasturtii]